MRTLLLGKVRRAVIVAPHPDDEAIGAYGLIRALRQKAARVRVVIVTGGTGSHPNSVRWPPVRLTALRRRETLAVLREIGIPKVEVDFLDLPDGGVTTVSGRQRQRLRRAVARARCDLLVLPAGDDDHPDHRAVAEILRSTRAARTLEYLVWPGRGARSRSASHMLRLGPLAPAKRGAILRYRSQTGAITDDPTGFAISHRELAAFSRPVERFREIRR